MFVHLTSSIVLAFLLALPSTFALAQKAQEPATDNLAKDIDSILDRLENRLQDEEANVLSPAEKQALTRSKDKPSKQVDIKEQKINVVDEKAEKLKKLASLVAELDDQIEKLGTDVQLTKQKAIENAKVDNYIEIEAVLADPDKLNIRTLNVAIDNYEVYALNEATGLWTPTNQIPIYAGPIQPGEHQVSVDARLIIRDEGKLPLNKSVHKTLKETYKIQIPDGVFKKRYVVKLTPPGSSNEAPKAELSQPK